MPQKNKENKKLKRRPHSISFEGVESLTKQSFKDECDVNKVIARFTRTGKLDHIARLEPQYGDAPEQNFFEASCIAADAASAVEEGLPGVDELETPETAPEEPTEDSPEESETVPEPNEGTEA